MSLLIAPALYLAAPLAMAVLLRLPINTEPPRPRGMWRDG